MHLAERQSRTATVLYPARNPEGRRFNAEDLWRIQRVGTPASAPNGSAIVVPVTSFDLDKNRGRTRLWLIPAEGAPRPLTSEEANAGDAVYSPDGTRLLFPRSVGEERPQVHVMPLDGGEPERLTDMPLGVFDPRWLPDGTRIVFGAMLLEEAPTPEGTKDLLEQRAKDPVKAHVTESRLYRYWDRWLTGGEVPHLFLLDLATRALTDLTPAGTGWFDFMEPSGQYDIAPDGSEIAFVANSSRPPHHLLRWALFTVPVGGGAIRCLTPEGVPQGCPADMHRPRYAPDKRSIVYGAQKDPYFYADRVRLMRYDREAGTHAPLAEGWDRSPSAWEFTPDGTLIIECEDEGRVSLFSMAPGGGTPRVIVQGGSAAALATGPGGRVTFTLQTITEPAEACSCLPDGSDFRRHTAFNAPLLSEIAWGEVRTMEFEGAGGESVQMYVVLPPNFDASKKWPLVHVIHGGPHGIAGDNFHFRWNLHAFAAPGYVVAAVNFHGSTSWGQEFAGCIQGGHGDKPYTDIMKATDTLIEAGFVDPSRMAATGGSYGGYLVCWIAGQTDRFRCLVNHAGVFDLLAEYGSDVTQGRHQAYGGEPWDRLEAIDRWSPARFARGFVTPMLVIHGERDFRVPHNQAMAVYNIYKAKGVDARLVFFPDENHWILKPRNSLLWNREVRGWLARWLGPAPAGPASGLPGSAGSAAGA
ncbi:MAG TPA: S9 family peptidase [Candidatus Eisenbacteria bacterium]|nr:S9 family peptidase [Candidatus Eisenbacteria bacterium]